MTGQADAIETESAALSAVSPGGYSKVDSDKEDHSDTVPMFALAIVAGVLGMALIALGIVLIRRVKRAVRRHGSEARLDLPQHHTGRTPQLANTPPSVLAAVAIPEATKQGGAVPVAKFLSDAVQRVVLGGAFYLTRTPARIKQVLTQVYSVSAENVDDDLVSSIESPAYDKDACEVF